MRGINYHFATFEELARVLQAAEEEQDMDLPRECSERSDELGDGEWVLASFAVKDETTSVAACAVDRGAGLRLIFEDRDWEKLWQFANQKGPPSMPPSMKPQAVTELLPPTGAHILIIDDDLETREVTMGLLSASGYVVTCVASAEQAFDELRDINVDLILLEWALPGISGTDFCKRIRRDRRFASMPLVFLSTHSSSDNVVSAFAAGADDYVSKPFRAPELAARLIGLLRRSRMPAHDSAPEH